VSLNYKPKGSLKDPEIFESAQNDLQTGKNKEKEELGDDYILGIAK
jgi:hypothetical protein